ncbi:hypothetical protein ACPCG0_04875 [Propionibacteriaceae bacterium Y1923]
MPLSLHVLVGCRLRLLHHCKNCSPIGAGDVYSLRGRKECIRIPAGKVYWLRGCKDYSFVRPGVLRSAAVGATPEPGRCAVLAAAESILADGP